MSEHLSPGFRIKNCTRWPITVSLEQVGPLYYGLVQPCEVFDRTTGAVWFTIKASISADNKCHIDDWDCAMPIIAVTGGVLAGALTGGYGAFGAMAGSVGASALVSGGLVSVSEIVVPAALGGALAATATGTPAALGKIFSKGCDAKSMGCYAGPPWPFRTHKPEYSVIGGPIPYLAEGGRLGLEPGSPVRIVKGFQPFPSLPRSAERQKKWPAVTIRPRNHPDFRLNLHGDDGCNGATVNLWEENGHASQVWEMHDDGTIRHGGHPDRCLNLQENHARNGATVNLWQHNGNESQQWAVTDDGTIRPTAHEGFCLNLHENHARNGATINLWEDNGNESQQWVVEPVKGTAARSGDS